MEKETLEQLIAEVELTLPLDWQWLIRSQSAPGNEPKTYFANICPNILLTGTVETYKVRDGISPFDALNRALFAYRAAKAGQLQ